MTREEVLLNSIWTEGKLIVHSDFFDMEVQIDLYTSEYSLRETHKILSEKFVQCINDFLNLPESSRRLMQKLVYQHCLESCESASYGFEVAEGEDETEVNMKAFGVHNEQTALEKANLHHVVVDTADVRKHRYVKIVFYPEWENEHGCELILKNGVLLDFYGETGTYVVQFDE